MAEKNEKLPPFRRDYALYDWSWILTASARFERLGGLSMAWFGIIALGILIILNAVFWIVVDVGNLQIYINYLGFLVVLLSFFFTDDQKFIKWIRIDTSVLRKEYIQAYNEPLSKWYTLLFFFGLVGFSMASIVWVSFVLSHIEMEVFTVHNWFKFIILLTFFIGMQNIVFLNRYLKGVLLKMTIIGLSTAFLSYLYVNLIESILIANLNNGLSGYLVIYPTLVLLFINAVYGFYRMPYSGFILRRSRIIVVVAMVLTPFALWNIYDHFIIF